MKRAKARPAKADGAKAKIEIAIPAFGYKTHVSIDRKHGFVRRFPVTSAAADDGVQLTNVLDAANTGSELWADTAHRAKTNEAYLANHGRRSKIQFRRQPGLDPTPAQRKANRARSKVRSAVETVFGGQKPSLRPVRAYHWAGLGPDQDRARQSRLQPQALPLDRSPAGGGLKDARGGPYAP